MSAPSVEIWLSGAPIGLLRRAREGLTAFILHEPWVLGGQHPRLGLGFLRDASPRRAGTGLPEWFENLLPEPGSHLRARLAAEFKLREHDSLGLLINLGLDLPGAVELRSLNGERDEPEELTAPITRARARDEDRFRFSLAGMQLKFSMSARGQRFSLAASAGDRGWIVKLPDDAHPLLPKVEDATMAWARACGHDVPTHRVVSVSQLDGLTPEWLNEGGEAFAIERFDRRDDGTRVHHEDFCQALELLPIHKYGDSGPRPTSHDGIMRLVYDAAGEEQAREHARRVGFVIASGNTDAHLKNWSFEWGAASRPHLSPCYDQVCTIAWRRYGWERKGGPKLALSLGRVKRLAQLDRDALARHAERAGLAWVRDEVMAGLERARHAWASVADQAPREMTEALQVHWRQTPLLRDLGGLPR